MGFNSLTISGRIGRDAEFRAFPGGGGVLSFPVATNSGYGDKEKTLWLRCNIFGKRAEGGLRTYLVKGQEVIVSGELSENEYTTKEGEQRKSLEVNVQNVELVGGKPQQQAAAPSHAGQPAQSVGGAIDPDANIPF